MQVILRVIGYLSVWVTVQLQNTFKNHYSFKEYITTLKEPKYNIYQNLIMVMNENPFWAKINYIE